MSAVNREKRKKRREHAVLSDAGPRGLSLQTYRPVVAND